MSFKLATVLTSLSALSVSGVTIYDSDEIPDEISARQCPALFPEIDGMISGLSISRETTGLDSDARKNITYRLHYVYLHQPVGSGRGLSKVLPGMVDNIVAIFEAMADTSTPNGAVDITPNIDGDIGMVIDAAGGQFYGCKIVVDVLEYYEV